MTALKDLQYMEKADTDISFSSLLSIKVTLSSLKAAQWFWHKNIHTHTSCIGNLCPFPDWCLATRSQTHNVNTEGFPVFSGGHSWPLFLLHFLSFVYYRSIFFQFPPTHPLSSSRRRARLCFERMRHHWWRSHPTHQQ